VRCLNGLIIYIHCVSKKVHPYDFHDNNAKCKLLYIIFGRNVAEETSNVNANVIFTFFSNFFKVDGHLTHFAL